MFCFQTTGSQGCDKSKAEIFLPESRSGVNDLGYDSKCLSLSESNLPDANLNLKYKKWGRWKTNGQIGLGLDFLLRNRARANDEKRFGENRKKVAKRKKVGTPGESTETMPSTDEMIISQSDALVFDDARKKTFLPCLNSFHVNDVQFIDESDSGSIGNDFVEEAKDCLGNGNGEDETVASIPVHSDKEEISDAKRRKSITLDEANNYNNNNNDNNNSICNDNEVYLCSKSETDGVPKSESARGFYGLSETLVMVHVDNGPDGCDSQGNEIDEIRKNSEKNCNGKKLKQQKVNSGNLFLSFCSLFNLSKLPVGDSAGNASTRAKNNGNSFSHNDISRGGVDVSQLSCCPLGSQQANNFPETTEADSRKTAVSEIVVINKSPKSKNKSFLKSLESVVGSDVYELQNYSRFNYDSSSSSEGTFSDGLAPMASPEVISLSGNVVPSKISSYLNCEIAQQSHAITDSADSLGDLKRPSTPSATAFNSKAKLKLLHEGVIQVCYLNHKKNSINKVLNSKFLRRWETHHVLLTDDYICSKTPTGFLESPVLYSALDEIYVVGQWDQGNRFCIRLIMVEGSLLLQTNNSLIRDQWLSSILWKKSMYKYRNILQSSKRPEVILKKIKGLINTFLNCHLQDDCITNVPIEIISKVLNEDEIWDDRLLSEEVISAIAPLLEESTPSPEMFHFFSRHCLRHPRSPVVVDVFTSIVNRILKRTVDFGKSPLMRRFVTDYLKALHLQNDGDEAIRKFVKSIHGPTYGCPHPRVLSNLVAVNLAAVFSNFEHRKTLLTESGNESTTHKAVQLLDQQLECYITLFLTISEFEDWRPGLAQLLQPIPFPDDALPHDVFIKGFAPVIRSIATDSRCEVHETVLEIRENKEGWLNVFCPSSLVCKDEGILWCQMLQTLFSCCCRRKCFLQKMVKHLGALCLVALRDHAVAQEILCLMLEWRLIDGEDQEMQVVTTLQSTENGRLKYNDLCRRQEHLKELQRKGGPKKLTLPNRSTDSDVARLLSCGSFGSLECLSLAFTHVTSACAHYLIQLPSLRYLNLWATQFGDAGLMIIADHLDKLQVLNLCETPVSDKGILAITGMKGLKKLNLNSTKLSPHTLDRLKQKLPSLQELDVRYTDAWTKP